VDASKNLKRYNMVLPEPLYLELQDAAKQNDITIVELLRRFIKLGLIVHKVSKDPGAAFLIRTGDTEREVLFL
jgi:hypothetical protein